MDNKRKARLLLGSEAGQSTVEYVLLFAVVASLSVTVFKSATFQQFLGPNSSLFQVMAKKMEFSYRNGHNGTDDEFADGGSNYQAVNHGIFYNRDDGKSRFFSPTAKYEE